MFPGTAGFSFHFLTYFPDCPSRPSSVQITYYFDSCLASQRSKVNAKEREDGSSYQRLDPVLLLHLLPQLLEAGLQPLVEGPQRLGHLLPVDPHAFGQVRDLRGRGGEEGERLIPAQQPEGAGGRLLSLSSEQQDEKMKGSGGEAAAVQRLSGSEGEPPLGSARVHDQSCTTAAERIQRLPSMNEMLD